MTDEGRPPADEDAPHRRGLRFRRREDLAVELFREALEKLDDIERVGRILLELGRFYNPYVNAPIVAPGARREILEVLARGDRGTARRLLEDRLASYTGAAGTDR